MATKKAIAVKMNVSATPDTNKITKFPISGDTPRPYIKNGIPKPTIKLVEREHVKPKYCPKKISRLFKGCANNKLVKSWAL